jgi:hypothetical protein
MGRIVGIVVVLVAVVVAAAYLTDMPILRPVRVITGKIVGGVPQPPKSIESCYECEVLCARQFEKCKETQCDASGKKELLEKCVPKCTDQYRACYFSCTGKYGKDQCPRPTVDNVR